MTIISKTPVQKKHKELQTQIFAHLLEIQSKVKAHGKNGINYGHVGDLNHILEELEQLKSFLS